MANPFKYLPFILILFYVHSVAQVPSELFFQNPPNTAKPRVWWHWMNGNITKEGIQKDLEWMSRVGIGGFQNFDANLFTPSIVSKKLVFMTPEWKDAFKFTTELASNKRLEMAIAGSPGWSVTGGPWVEAKDGMKKYVWSETYTIGGKTQTIQVARPEATTGKFQNVGLPQTSMMGESLGVLPTYYQDAAVIAYKLPASEKLLSVLKPAVHSSGGHFSLEVLTDSDLNKSFYLPPVEVGQDMWIQYEFDIPQSFKAFSIAGANHNALEDFNGGPENRILKVSDDGIAFREIAKVSGSIVPQNTVAFAPVTAKFWRITFKTLPAPFNPFASMFGGGDQIPAKPEGVNVAEFVLFNTDRIDQFEDKAGFTPWKEERSFGFRISDFGNSDAIPTDHVIDLTNLMLPDGTLSIKANSAEIRNTNTECVLPEGNWVIIRFGYSLTGRQNHPASPEATGLEVDKLDKIAVKKYINTYLDMYKSATGGKMGVGGLEYMVLDSYEAGHMTWTKTFPEEFNKRRGYDIKKWIPVLTGRVVNSRVESENFLWDFRKTIGELIVSHHYDVIGEELAKRNMKRYTESHENKRIYLADGMDVKRKADIPMSAMWTPGSLAGGSDEEVRSEADIRESASVANIYGKKIVAAESMTAMGNAYAYDPARLKRTADLELASGLNRFVIHTSVHQPLDDKKPGFSLGPFGQWFTRQETWAEQGKVWMGYLGRSCYLMQQGKNVADLLYYYGENQNITSLCQDRLPAIPSGYEFDFVNATALLHAIRVVNGKIVAQSGNTYHLLVLDETAKFMTLPVLKKLRQLILDGAKIAGNMPQQSPSLADDPMEFQAVLKEIQNHANIIKSNISEALDLLKVPEDVIIENTNHKILFRHRTSEIANPKSDINIYWLNNRSDQPTQATLSFRIADRIPEIWNPITGKTGKVSYTIKDGRTIIPLLFESWDAFFIVFRAKTTTNSYTVVAATTETLLQSISTPWIVKFNTSTAQYNTLASWTESEDPAIKYFSGTATYENTFTIPSVHSSSRYRIDLGEVKNIAEVIVNGKSSGIVWKKPFKVDVSDAIKPGNNTIQIKVTNLWVNRLIGDAQPETKLKTTFTTMPFYQTNSPLLPSGLLTTVQLLEIKPK